MMKVIFSSCIILFLQIEHEFSLPTNVSLGHHTHLTPSHLSHDIYLHSLLLYYGAQPEECLADVTVTSWELSAFLYEAHAYSYCSFVLALNSWSSSLPVSLRPAHCDRMPVRRLELLQDPLGSPKPCPADTSQASLLWPSVLSTPLFFELPLSCRGSSCQVFLTYFLILF